MAAIDAGEARARTPRRPPDRRNAFRPDVQGLRAIAVLTVIAAHAGVAGLEGGFVGVDVFFVISGFLISQLLFREVRAGGRISLARFYARRARRILPAATVVTLVTLVASTMLLSLVDAQPVVDDAVWAAFFAANIRFATVGADYFAQSQGPSPLQHYWSLAVEEQFYLLWPLLLLVLVGGAALSARRATAPAAATGTDPAGRLPVRAVAVALAVVCTLSLAWSLVATSTSPVTAYFSTLARAWELGTGALVALAGPALVRSLTPRARGLLALAGLAAIAVACLTYTEATALPGGAALLPVLGSAAVLLAGTDLRADRPLPLLLRGLGTPPMRTVGDWSYSLYLWHWPVLILLEARYGQPGPAALSLAVALVFLLSALTHRYVETPFRTGARITLPRHLVLYPVSLALVATAATGGWTYLRWSGGELGDEPAISVQQVGSEFADFDFADERAEALVQASVLAARRGDARPSDLSPDLLAVRDDVPGVGACDYGEGSRALCPGGDTDGEKTLVVLGDSHARMWIPALEQVAERAGYRTYHLVKVQCTASDVLVGETDRDEPWQECADFHDWTYEQLQRLRPDLVVVSTSPPSTGVYVDGEHRSGANITPELRDGYDRLFDRATAASDRVTLLRDVPHAADDPAACLTRGRDTLRACMFRPDGRAERMAQVSVSSARAAGVDVVDPRPWLCWQRQCPAVVGSTITYRDEAHLTGTYAGGLADSLGQALGLGPRSLAAGAAGG